MLIVILIASRIVYYLLNRDVLVSLSQVRQALCRFGLKSKVVSYYKKRKQDHRFIKKRIRNMLGLKSLQTATKMIAGIEAMHIIKKGQTLQGEKSVQRQMYLINEIFGLTA
ncbi:insertion sequence IS240 protein (plasmid) [Bacillus thuringiensis YBT-1518]|uniref:Insertion sequence IS240 protein n=1 Tax=Bacillus thuringiensis YBT-1518 TaxID=529122 RepID=A0A9W3KJD4_BACTU|nr:insertion sequence IS240 protein [Bacillus thuringiensis YBT-1518]